MRKSRLALIAILVIAILVSPFLLGYWVEKNYRQLISFYNSQGNFTIVIKTYQKSWISAHATLAVSSAHLPQTLEFTVNQDIHYGPIILTHRNFKSLILELAFIHSEIMQSPETAHIIETKDNASVMQVDDDVSFTGKNRIHFQSPGFKLNFAALNKKIELGGFSGNVAITPATRQVKGKITAENFSLDLPQFSLVANKVYLRFNQKLLGNDLWLGTNKMSFSEATIQDASGRMLIIMNFDSSGNLQQRDTGLNLERSLSLDKLKIADQQIGPIDLQMNMTDLSAQAMKKIFDTYRKILNTENKVELLQQLYFLMPTLVTNETTMSLKNLQVDTVDGKFKMNGDIDWAGNALQKNHNFKDVFSKADAQGSVRVSATLATDLIQVVADLSYVKQRMADPHKPYLSFQQHPDILAKQSAMEVAIFIQDNQLSKDVGMKLLALQQADTSEADYAATVAQLVADKKISPTMQKTLNTQFHQLKFAGLSTPEKFAYLEDQFHATFDEWVKNGYITLDKDDYVTTVKYQQGLVKLNGNPVSNADKTK